MISDAFVQIVVLDAETERQKAGLIDNVRNAVYRNRPGDTAGLECGREVGFSLFKCRPPWNWAQMKKDGT